MLQPRRHHYCWGLACNNLGPMIRSTMKCRLVFRITSLEYSLITLLAQFKFSCRPAGWHFSYLLSSFSMHWTSWLRRRKARKLEGRDSYRAIVLSESPMRETVRLFVYKLRQSRTSSGLWIDMALLSLCGRRGPRRYRRYGIVRPLIQVSS